MRHLRRWYVYLPVSALLIGVVIWRAQPWNALDRLAGVPPWVPVAAILLSLALIPLWADRSAALLTSVGYPMSRLSLLPIVAFANTINNLTPASSGEAMRALVLRARHGVPIRRSAPVILMERLYALYLMGITAVGLALVEEVNKPVFVLSAFAILTGLAFVPNLAYEFLHVRPLAWLGRQLARIVRRPTVARLAAVLVEVDDDLDQLLTHPRQALGFVLRTLLVFAVYASILTLVLYGLGEALPPWTAWAALGLAMVAGVLSSLPFGLGATDTVLTLLLVRWGVPADVAALSALLLRLLQTLPTGLIGVVSYLYVSRTMGIRLSAENVP
jgi:glycosyltransferase 2 family protein